MYRSLDDLYSASRGCPFLAPRALRLLAPMAGLDPCAKAVDRTPFILLHLGESITERQSVTDLAVYLLIVYNVNNLHYIVLYSSSWKEQKERQGVIGTKEKRVQY